MGRAMSSWISTVLLWVEDAIAPEDSMPVALSLSDYPHRRAALLDVCAAILDELTTETEVGFICERAAGACRFRCPAGDPRWVAIFRETQRSWGAEGGWARDVVEGLVLACWGYEPDMPPTEQQTQRYLEAALRVVPRAACARNVGKKIIQSLDWHRLEK